MESMLHSPELEHGHQEQEVASAVLADEPKRASKSTSQQIWDDEEEDETSTHDADADADDADDDDESTNGAAADSCIPFGSGGGALSERSISNTSISSNTSNKSVRWSTIEVHSHNLVLGDHAVEDGGPPLSIGWNKISTIELSIDDYESERGPVRRIESIDLIVPADVRRRRLLERGYSESEIKTRELTANQKSRRKSSSPRGSRLRPLVLIRRNLVTLVNRPKVIEVRTFSD